MNSDTKKQGNNIRKKAKDTNKKGKKKMYERFKYTEEDMQNALKCFRKGMPLSQASKTYNVPKSTLHAKVTEKVPEDRKMGPKSVLTEVEELRLEKWILNQTKLGFPMHPDDVRNAVQHILQKVPRENPFTNKRPGIKWFQLFLKRHPSIIKQNAKVLTRSKAALTEESLRKWFKETENFLKDNDILMVLERPHSIFTSDETKIQLYPKSGILFAPKGEKNVDKVAPETEKESITVLCTFSAAGKSVPPMIIYPYKRIPGPVAESVPPEWPIGKSESGSMISSIFFEYMAHIFYPWCLTNKVEFPIIFFLDGDKSRMSLELSEFCVDKKIILYCLPPTHIMQPCDVSIFESLKASWNSVVQEHKQETGKAITRTTFAPLFKKAFDKFLNEKTIKNGFKSCGLYPFDANALDYSQCISRRRADLSTSPNQELNKETISTNDLITLKNSIEHLIGDINVQHYSSIKNNNEISHDSLYTLWKLCVDHIEDTSTTIDLDQFQNSISDNLNRRIHTNNASSSTDISVSFSESY